MMPLMKKLVCLLLLFLVGCQPADREGAQDVLELKAHACAIADQSQTCQTKLLSLDLITPRECCQQFGACCNAP